jgi:hypothetical protein
VINLNGGVDMQRTIPERVEASFAKDEEKLFRYLEWLRASMAELSQNVRRMALMLLLLVAAFEFLLNTPNVEITLGIVKITSSPVVLQLIPAVVSYVFLQMWLDSMRINLLSDVFRATFACWSSRGSMNDLDLLIMPRFYLFWSPGSGVKEREVNARRSDKAERFAASVFLAIVVIGMMIFQAQAYIILYLRGLPADDRFILREPNLIFFIQDLPRLPVPGILWLISLAVTLFCFTIINVQVFSNVVWRQRRN